MIIFNNMQSSSSASGGKGRRCRSHVEIPNQRRRRASLTARTSCFDRAPLRALRHLAELVVSTMRNREPLSRAVIRKGRRQRPFNIAVALRARRYRWARRSPCCENMEGGFHYHKRCDGCSVSRTYDQKDSLLREPHTLFAQRIRPLRHRHTCLPDLIRRGGGTAACAPPPVSLSAQAPDEGPLQLHIGASRRQRALAVAISPVPCRKSGNCDKGQPQQRPTSRLVPS